MWTKKIVVTAEFQDGWNYTSVQKVMIYDTETDNWSEGVPGPILSALKWTDFDFENKTVNITPEKGSEPRQLKISPQLISMLNSPPKKKDEPFACSSRHFTRTFRRQRSRIANKLENSRIDLRRYYF